MSSPATEHMIEHPSERMVQDRAAAVEGAIWAFDPIRQSNARLAVTEHEGVVTLAGNVRSSPMKAIAGRLAFTVPGVQRVINAIVADPEIEAQAALAIATAPDLELFTDRMALRSFLGDVTMEGLVAAPELAEAEARRARVEALVAELPGVHRVDNRLKAIESAGATAPEAEETPVAAGGSPEAEAMAARLAIWRERAKAAGKLG